MILFFISYQPTMSDNLDEEQPEAPTGNPPEETDVKLKRYKEQLD